MPLIDLDYTLPVGLANTRPAGTPTVLTVEVRHQPGYRNPALSATNGFVGIRVSATDAQGNSVVQLVKRAYRLTAGP